MMKNAVRVRYYLYIFFFILVSQTVIEATELTDAQKKEIIYNIHTEYTEKFPSVRDISPHKAMKLMAADHVLFVDTREPAEMDISKLPGAITEEEYLIKAVQFKNRTVVAYCTIGYRSGKFAMEMAKKGVTVYNLSGGILAWIFEGGRIYDKNGQTKRVHVYSKEWNYLPRGYESVMFGFFNWIR